MEVRDRRRAAPDIDRLYQAIYLQNFDYVWRQLRRLGIATADLPDVTHDVFVIVHRRLDSFDRDAARCGPGCSASCTGWRRITSACSARRTSCCPDHGAVGFDPEDPAPLPDDALLDRQTRAVASQALDGLDVRLRSVLEMHDLGGRAVPEIAEALQIPVKTVYSPVAPGARAAGHCRQPPDDHRRLNDDHMPHHTR